MNLVPGFGNVEIRTIIIYKLFNMSKIIVKLTAFKIWILIKLVVRKGNNFKTFCKTDGETFIFYVKLRIVFIY